MPLPIVAASRYYTCAIVNGGVQCWGRNEHGQLGDGTKKDRTLPVQASGLSHGVTAIATGAFHACAVQNRGLKCWGGYHLPDNVGHNHYGPDPVSVAGLKEGVTSVAAGVSFTCALAGGKVKCWGNNFSVHRDFELRRTVVGAQDIESGSRKRVLQRGACVALGEGTLVVIHVFAVGMRPGTGVDQLGSCRRSQIDALLIGGQVVQTC
jgi:hypothetical protein